jgi:hypothetical protein
VVRVFGREVIHEKRDYVNENITLGDAWLMCDQSLMLGFGGFDSRDIDSEMMGKSRAIAAIEPVQGDTELVADSLGRVNG